MSFLATATGMAQRGVAVTPTYPGLRHPAKDGWNGKDGWYAATTDLNTIEAWAKEDPNFNCCCIAKHDGIFMLDIDDLAAAQKRGMPLLPETFTVQTPGGGLHVYFKHTAQSRSLGNNNVYEGEGKSKKKIVEIKGHNVSVCAPGCTRDDGGVYKIVRDKPFAQMSIDLYEWLLANAIVPVATSSTGTERKFHPDFDREEFHEHYDWEFVGDPHTSSDGREYYTFQTCPMCGRECKEAARRVSCLGYGSKGVFFDCKACGEGVRFADLMAKMKADGIDDYPYFIYEDDDPELAFNKASFPVAEPEVEDDTPETPAVAETEKPEEEKTCADVRKEIDEMMHADSETINLREKQRFVCEMIYKHMMANGKLFNCGNVATYVDDKTREIIQITNGSPHFERLLMRYGVFPADKLTPAIGRFLGSMATTAKENTVYAMSYYDADQHLLYVNEYAGNFLRMDGDGKITRLRNGDDDMLFTDGKDGQCDPLCADLDNFNDSLESRLTTRRFYPGESSLITKEILNTILYPEDGVGEENAKIILMTAILALFFQERIPATPFVYLYGIGASMKSSLAVKIGKLIQGRKFKARPATDDEKALKDMALSMPFVVLDEANKVKSLTDILKVVATGGMDTRRELYTTAQMRHTPYQARIWMTANTASLTNETISSRMMIIDAGQRDEEEPYRSEHYIKWSAAERNAIWTELIGRLANAMRELAQADAKGEGDLNVSHRMSSFFVFGRTLARQEDWEERFLTAMRAMEERQMGASAEDSEIVHLIQRLPASYNVENKGGKTTGFRTAEEWSGILGQMVPDANVELVRKVAREGWVRYMFQANAKVLANECGMVVGSTTTKQKNKIKTYGFTKCAGSAPKMELEAADVL